MTFHKWIKSQGGPTPVAQKLGITSACVRYWLRRDATPRLRVMKKIVKLSKGQVTLDTIVRETC